MVMQVINLEFERNMGETCPALRSKKFRFTTKLLERNTMSSSRKIQIADAIHQ
jgi:hypothetical protein